MSAASDSQGVASTFTRQTIDRALDVDRLWGIEEFAGLAASYWRSIAEAAARGERLTIELHCRQVAAVTREAFRTVKTLGRRPNDIGGQRELALS